MSIPETTELLGIGFGPSNLALAIALAEQDLGALFVEAQPKFSWHRGMLLPHARMQIPFLKDLVSLRNVKSDFTFVNYLSERGRLVEFIGRHTLFPSRLEYHDYLEWAAARFAAHVRYGHRVVEITSGESGFVVRTGAGRAIAATTLVLGTGLRPALPEGIQESARQWHSSRLLGNMAERASTVPRRFAVVGAGQSAAEVAAHLHDTYPRVEVHAVYARYGYSAVDDSAYANRIFDPSAVDDFYDADDLTRRRLFEYHRSTNYSAVDPQLIDELYSREYAERVSGRRRLFMHNMSEVLGAQEHPHGVRLTLANLADHSEMTLDCDVVVYATGYAPLDFRRFLGELSSRYEFDSEGRPAVTRDYRLVPKAGAPGDIYLNGSVEHTHGLASSLLSNVGVRAGEIAATFAARQLRGPRAATA
ncbi:MAG: lysine N(6)-hydroxylase/L-ornithine N(5)-oxygenase family protein [Mycobacterium sp.]|uniref:lysine N(6)-hydroxylase/L-ornithine N(5)-oxygenase family protein n=1 Tax=Mycobacterium sp. TaxID=1785 RepID=UPI001ECB1A25|nr:SidA/IucD/PvdA family monooxygenase [Mycobacterium sp.]MBW0015943.1 lysine N(6)-hydroxylase/L-ornithine N(5)-oxygenase family protein [Mycobacterium sp.]